MFPVSSAPRALKVLMLLDPVAHGVDGIRGPVLSATSTGVNAFR